MYLLRWLYGVFLYLYAMSRLLISIWWTILTSLAWNQTWSWYMGFFFVIYYWFDFQGKGYEFLLNFKGEPAAGVPYNKQEMIPPNRSCRLSVTLIPKPGREDRREGKGGATFLDEHRWCVCGGGGWQGEETDTDRIIKWECRFWVGNPGEKIGAVPRDADTVLRANLSDKTSLDMISVRCL